MRRGRTHPEWANMVGPFGGITAAVMLRAIESQPERVGEPLALTVNYAAPIADGDFDLSLRAARTNRTNQHWIAELSQDGGVKTKRRCSLCAATAGPIPRVPRRACRTRSSCLPPIRAWCNGRASMTCGTSKVRCPARTGNPAPPRRPPWGARPSPTTRRLPGAGRAVRHLLPADLPAARPRHPGGDDLVDDLLPRRPAATRRRGDFVLCTAHANTFSGGYFDQSAEVWARDGVLLATTHQVVYFKG
ncbi:acyl-CoA thioesterase [Mycobacterium paraseoulense]|nr:acyl-CoA thioesterase [Mycobacterium paraseoulense]